MDEVWQFYAECHAIYGDVVTVETGRRISIWRTFEFFQNGDSYISAVD